MEAFNLVFQVKFPAFDRCDFLIVAGRRSHYVVKLPLKFGMLFLESGKMRLNCHCTRPSFGFAPPDAAPRHQSAISACHDRRRLSKAEM
tara:strand:- start:145 stop:411 length:267 start_codon:yes stop_codon:yes gene_type:complete